MPMMRALLNRFSLQIQQEQQDSYLQNIQTLITNIECAKIAYYKLTKVIQECSIQLQMFSQQQSREGVSAQSL